MRSVRLVDGRDVSGTWMRLSGLWLALFLVTSVWIRNRPLWLPHGRIQVSPAAASTIEAVGKPGALVRQRFTIANRGNGLLHIVGITPGCGCTAAVAGAKVLEPAQETYLDVTLSGDEATSSDPKRIWIATDDPREPSVVVDVGGDPAAGREKKGTP